MILNSFNKNMKIKNITDNNTNFIFNISFDISEKDENCVLNNSDNKESLKKFGKKGIMYANTPLNKTIKNYLIDLGS